MSHVWSFEPDSPASTERKPYRARKKKEPSWLAPEHIRSAMGMRRDYPRDENGVPLPGKPRELVVDPRPVIMVPEKNKPRNWL